MRALTAAPLALGLEPREYENFTFDSATAATVTSFVIALCLGIIVAALYNYYIHRVPGAAIRALLHAEALSPESAKTAAELGLSHSPLALWELTRGNSLARLTRLANDPQDEKADRRSPDARFYIPEELKYRAEIRFDKKGNGTFGLVFTCLLAVGVAALILALLPWFLGVIDGMM